MKNRKVRLHLVFFHAMLPYTAGGISLGAIVLILSFFFKGGTGDTFRLISYSVFLAFTVFGLVQSLIILWKTRDIE